MDVSQVSVRERLDHIGLSTEEKKAVNVKIIEGLVNPSNWIFLDDADLAESLRKLIHQGMYDLFLLLYHIINFVLYICFLLFIGGVAGERIYMWRHVYDIVLIIFIFLHYYNS
jgi:hypothetical protein